MGCCLGTTAATTTTTNHRQPPPVLKQPPPLPPAFEEETVKEVLSETPIIPKNPSPSKTTPPPSINLQSSPEVKTEVNGVVLTKTLTEKEEEIHENDSEMYSYSESFSAATTATTMADNKKDEIEIDEDGEVTQKLKKNNKSPPPPAKRVAPRKRPSPAVSSGELGGRRDRPLRPSPARRQTMPSPEKKPQLPTRTAVNGQRHRNVGPANDSSRRDVSGRRSRSPAVRGEAGQRRKVRERSPADKSGDGVPATVVESEDKSRVEKVEDDGGSPDPLPVPEPETRNLDAAALWNGLILVPAAQSLIALTKSNQKTFCRRAS